MPAKKHDWEQYKTDFFNSAFDSIKDFFDSFVIPVPKPSYKARTQGWIEEKRAYKKQQAEAARAKAANDPDVQDLSKQLIIGKNNALKIVMAKLVKEKDQLGMRDLREGIDIIKRELGEPLTISENKNKNENTQIINLQGLDTEDLERLADIQSKLNK
jgi:hypothetical protein